MVRENTIHDIQQGINKSTIVTEVDPDAPLRQNKKLSELDEVMATPPAPPTNHPPF